MNEFVEKHRIMDHVTGHSVTGIVTPSKHGPMAGRLKICACGVETTNEKCGVCNAEYRAGLSLRVFKR
jgi:hypothetical protein